MSRCVIDEATLTGIADGIRKKTNTTDTITPENMASGISSIPISMDNYDEYNKMFINKITNCYGVEDISFPSAITSIGDYAFHYCTNLKLTELPDGITRIGRYAFYGCANLTLTELPAGITSIGDYAFLYCANLKLTELPAGITRIGAGVFSGCTNLTSLTFKGTPTSISVAAFYGCSNLKTINVPWAEGAVAGAPWNATNATINYNYKG